MKKVFIVHGFEGKPNGGWRSWMMDKLAEEHTYACSLAMPNASNPIQSEWVKEISRHVETNKRDQIYLVGHSLGVPAILRFLEKTKAKNVNGIVLVSGPIFKTSKKKVAEFLKKPFNFKVIKSKVKKIAVIHGVDDKMVSFDQAEFLSQELNAELIAIKKGGHLNGASGWIKLPICLKILINMMK